MITDGPGLVPPIQDNVADDAGALLVRSGLVSSSALDDARAIVTEVGGTIGEQLVAKGAIEDDALTDFYRSRLLVPQVNPNTLARLPVKVIAAIPSDMAIELRAIPVALDNDNNLTVAMSDPSDRHAVDEIAFFTGTYVVRAVASQMQIAWCLAHYYGHLTALGLRLLQPGASPAPTGGASAPQATIPRTKGDTGRVEITRHHAVAPRTGPIDAVRPSSDPLDPPSSTPAPAPTDDDATPNRPRARSISGEIRVPVRRAPSIRPPIPEAHSDEDSGAASVIDQISGPVITMEVDEPDEGREGAGVVRPDEDPTGPRKLPPRRRKAKTDPPELAARAGEVNIDTGPVRLIDDDEPRIIIAEDALAPPPSMIETEASGELDSVVPHRPQLGAPATTIEVDDTSVGVVIHEHYTRDDSEPVLLLSSSGHRAQTDEPTGQRRTHGPTAPEDGDDDVVVLDLPKPGRRDKRTQVGIGIVAAATRPHRDTESGGVPDMVVDDRATTSETMRPDLDGDPTRLNARAVAPEPGDSTDETLAAPPSPDRRDTGSHVATAPRPTAPRTADPRGHARPPSVSGDDDEGHHTAVMSAAELDEAIPARTSEVVPGHLRGAPTSNDYDPVDDGWGPPGTTIPPPLLGAIPGSDDDVPNAIPLDVDSAPLIVAPPSPPEASRGTPAAQTATSLVRALEEATSRSIELINALERTTDRNAVISLMIAHLAESHRRAGFFSIKPGAGLTIFSIHPTPSMLPTASLQLDRPSTLQDVVDTRLPYRGPMHDDASRTFLAAVLGACPPEILLVPVAIRERVVGVLFGEHRMRHTFDDQLALAARAAGMALERILKTKRS